MHRIKNKDGEADTLAGNPASPFGPPSGPNVIPFRRVEAAASCVGPAASSPYSADGLDAHFIPVGQAVAAVIMSLRGGFPRINCDRPGAWEDNYPDGLS